MSDIGDRWHVYNLPDTMTDYRMLKESKILRWWHIPERKNVTVTIEDVQLAKDKKVGDPQFLLSFVGAQRPYLTNATANKTLGRLYGKRPSNWRGKRITLYRTTTEFQGETVPCIRIRPQAPGANVRDQLPDEKAAVPNDDRPAPARALSDAELDAVRARAAAAQPGAPIEPPPTEGAPDGANGGDGEDDPDDSAWPGEPS